MRLTDLQKMRLFGYGTPEGAEKAWDTRGRKGSDDEDATAHGRELSRAATADEAAAVVADGDVKRERNQHTGKVFAAPPGVTVNRDKLDEAKAKSYAAHARAAKSAHALADFIEKRGRNADLTRQSAKYHEMLSVPLHMIE
ncbi:MAG: hypothetical protein KGL39_13615 [Patescibacteria group bacterium]|nr:hypothetical protein [Patescibacteria group bacterium]